MPFSGNDFVDNAVQFVRSNYKSGSKVLDIGAGAGKFGELFADLFKVDAVEIWSDYITEYKLLEKYNIVLNVDVRSMPTSFFSRYDLVFMWKTLEHLSFLDSRDLIGRIKAANVDFIFSVPFELKQGAAHGNPYEVHKQDDLTPNIVASRYPEFTPLWENQHHGVYFYKSGK